MNAQEKLLLKQLRSAIERVRKLQSHVRDTGGGVEETEGILVEGITTLCAVITRVAPLGSPYRQQANESLKYVDTDMRLTTLMGVTQALREDVRRGYTKTVTELLHAELFADFLEMADYLLEEGFKDAAAVIAGSSLEVHLRALCDKNDVPVECQTSKGMCRKKADSLNAELMGKKAYGKGDHKSVTAWLNTRNDAAHGEYSRYEPGQVKIMIAGVRNFITRNPA